MLGRHANSKIQKNTGYATRNALQSSKEIAKVGYSYKLQQNTATCKIHISHWKLERKFFI
jgi:hypothetical protein